MSPEPQPSVPPSRGDEIRLDVDRARDVQAGTGNVQQRITVDHINVFAGAPTTPLLDTIFKVDPELQSYDLGAHRKDALEYLSQLERFIQEDLSRAGDLHFVELSMQLAQPRGAPAPSSYGAFRLAPEMASTEHEIIKDLAELEDLILKQPMVLLGVPGSGKTTILHHLALRMIGDCRQHSSPTRLPLFVKLTNYKLSPAGGAPPAIEFLRSEVHKLVAKENFVAQQFDELLQYDKFVLLLDGLDQMPNRLSETIRINELKRVENDLKRVDRMLWLVRVLQQKGAYSRLLESRQTVATGAGPRPDPRELEFEDLRKTSKCKAIVSCRQFDFVGVPRWHRLTVLPMDEKQVQEFVDRYSPGAHALISQSLAASPSTHPLITNPFYLRLLTGALGSRPGSQAQTEYFRRALTHRGRLLEHLIREAIARSITGPDQPHAAAADPLLVDVRQIDARVEQLLSKLGDLAFYMLERNLIGSVPQGAVQEHLGAELPAVLKAAQDANLITLRDGEVTSIEFNHQLFLEFLLAFHLRAKSRQGEFGDALKLLSRRGDRWAETIRLLFDMTDERAREMLIGEFLTALQRPDTWDISTRVLADLGPQVAPYVAPLLRDPAEIVATGAAKILGKVRAPAAADGLAALANASSWRLRRAALEALAELPSERHLAAFDQDRHPSVIRALLKARLMLADNPQQLIQQELSNPNATRSEQMAFAVMEGFSSLSARLDRAALERVVEGFLSHKNQQVRMFGFLILSQAPDSLKRPFKDRLLRAALEDEDASISMVARRTVSRLLDPADMERLGAPPISIKPFEKPDTRKLRVFWLVLEVKETASATDFLSSLRRAPPSEMQLVTRKLSSRGDSTALSILTFLLSDPHTLIAAIEALVELGDKGIAHLLEALNDPSPDICLNVAKELQFCSLPRHHARRVRKILRQHKIRTHEAKPVLFGAPGSEMGQNWWQQFLFGVYGVAVGTGLLWAGLHVLGSRLALRGCLRYSLYAQKAPAAMSDAALWWVMPVEQSAFRRMEGVRDHDFWLARGRLERQLSDRFLEARNSFQQALSLKQDSTTARIELALMERALGNLEIALDKVTADDRQFMTPGSKLEILEELLLLEKNRFRPNEPSLQRLRLLDRLAIWPEAQKAAIPLTRDPGSAREAYLSLYHAYCGQKQPRKALAAALEHNRTASPEHAIPAIELDELHWQCKGEYLPEMTGRLGLALDLEQDDQAVAALLDLDVLSRGEDGALVLNRVRMPELFSAETAEVKALLGRLGLAQPVEPLKMRRSESL